MIRIGPSGNSIAFYESGHEHTYQAPQWLKEIGLNAFEYSFGRGVKISDSTAEKIALEMKKYDIELSVHAPYYTNLSNPDPEMIKKTFGYVFDSLIAMKKMGGKRVIFHPASCGKDSRDIAVTRAKENLTAMMQMFNETLPFNDYVLCPETMGKTMQIGTYQEIVDFCKVDEHLIPCYDFGHINAYSQGSLKTSDDYRKIIDYTFENLGEYKAKNIHIHFSKIMYGNKGEIKHLTFEDEKYGPDYEPLAKIIDEYDMTPVIICESDGTMSDDALKIKKYHKNI